MRLLPIVGGPYSSRTRGPFAREPTQSGDRRFSHLLPTLSDETGHIAQTTAPWIDRWSTPRAQEEEMVRMVFRSRWLRRMALAVNGRNALDVWATPRWQPKWGGGVVRSDRRRAARGRARKRVCDRNPDISDQTTFHGTSCCGSSTEAARSPRAATAASPGVTDRSSQYRQPGHIPCPTDSGGGRCEQRSSASTRNPIRRADISRPWRSTTWHMGGTSVLLGASGHAAGAPQ